MEKVYRLLRNNIEGGPYSIGELLQQIPGPADLVWVEGRSREWIPASSLEELNHPSIDRQEGFETRDQVLVSQQRTSSPPHSEERRDRAFTDSEDFELRVQELRKDITSYNASYHQIPVTGLSGASVYRGSETLDEIDLVFHKTEKEKYLTQFFLACIVFFLFLFGWYKGSILNRVTQHDDIAAKPFIPPVQNHSPAITPLTENAVAEGTPPDVVEETIPTVIKKQQAPRKKALPVVNVKKAIVVEPDQATLQTTVSSIETPVPEEPIAAPVEQQEQPAPAIERKKTLGQAIKGLFKKKNKKIDTAMGE
ncbi:MAG TPA: hypothetical protein VM935_10135 [Chitinophagaceae bacterium]|nr:hypothetical protein [Chitinophagaceae bacterium]